ncbi:hypothetical protein [Kitasatospora sp. HPMI-4]|uniref:hypothetical protein n=1 Tax=Kitasatospora sp. HPMI-4 TaxID=3448443 RepID=UPI003F1D240A
MTKRKTTASAQARALAASADLRYADALRQVRAGTGVLTAGLLLMEASTQPLLPPGDDWWVESDEFDEEELFEPPRDPRRYFSQLLGEPVPLNSVLGLVGVADRDAELVIEQHIPGRGVWVRIGDRRFVISLDADRSYRLCGRRGCNQTVKLSGRCYDHFPESGGPSPLNRFCLELEVSEAAARLYLERETYHSDLQDLLKTAARTGIEPDDLRDAIFTYIPYLKAELSAYIDKLIDEAINAQGEGSTGQPPGAPSEREQATSCTAQ